MLNTIKDFLFQALIIVGMIALIVTVFWWLLEVENRIFAFGKYIIMFHQYKRNEKLYDIKDKLIVSKDGHISYSCISDLDKQIEILNKAIEERKGIKEIWKERGKNLERYE